MHRLFLALTLAPVALWLLCVLAVLLLGQLTGCTLNEGAITPCLVFGRDIGEMAYTFGFIAAWGPLFLFPAAGGMAMIWVLVTLLRRLLAARR